MLPTPKVYRRRPARAQQKQSLLLVCPRISPEWELNSLRSLMKPKGYKLHQPHDQTWPRNAMKRIAETIHDARERLGIVPAVHQKPEGEYFFIAEFDRADADAARTWAVLLSSRLPKLWFVLDRLMIRNGRFFRRENGFKLFLVQATNVHLPRAMRSAVQDLIAPTKPQEIDLPTPRERQRRVSAFFIAHQGRREKLKRHHKQHRQGKNHHATPAAHHAKHQDPPAQ
jgi:hypothetical protein